MKAALGEVGVYGPSGNPNPEAGKTEDPTPHAPAPPGGWKLSGQNAVLRKFVSQSAGLALIAIVPQSTAKLIFLPIPMRYVLVLEIHRRRTNGFSAAPYDFAPPHACHRAATSHNDAHG